MHLRCLELEHFIAVTFLIAAVQLASVAGHDKHGAVACLLDHGQLVGLAHEGAVLDNRTELYEMMRENLALPERKLSSY